MSNSSSVRGPTSALTSFLREKGIRPPTQTRFQRIPVEEQMNAPSTGTETETAAVASTSNSMQIPDSAVASSLKFPKRKSGKDKEKDEEPSAKQRKVARKAVRAVEPAKEAHGLLMSELIRLCKQCNRRFVFEEDQQLNCSACLNVGILSATGGKRSSAAAKRALKKAEKSVLEMTGELQGYILPLRDMCIQTIVKHVDEMEYATTMAPETKRKMSRILSKQRKLDEHSLQLFLGENEDELELYDCTYLPEKVLNEIPIMCPELRVLKLGVCGRATDKTLDSIAENLPLLTSLSLHGTFLCSSSAYSNLFQTLSNLTVVDFEFAVKLSNEALDHLQSSCPRLSKLWLTDCPFIDDEGLCIIEKMASLQSLGLNATGELSDITVSSLISKIGPQLTHLSLNKQLLVGEKTLESLQLCQSLTSLSLQHCPALTSTHLCTTLSRLPPLSSLSLGGNNSIEASIVEVLGHHAAQLSHLDVNGLDLVAFDEDRVWRDMPMLRVLDVGWIRSVTDSFMRALFKTPGCRLERVKVFGCNLISREVLEYPWRNSLGKRILILGNEFD